MHVLNIVTSPRKDQSASRALVDAFLREYMTQAGGAFRLEPGVLISERYSQFRRKVHDFAQTLALFAIITVATAALAGSFAANLLHDVYAHRRRQYAMLLALGFSPMQTTMVGISVGVATAGAGALIACTPSHFAMPSLMADLGTIVPRPGGCWCE